MRVRKTTKNNMKKSSIKIKKSQSFSTDFIVAIVIFIGIILLFYSLLNSGKGTKAAELQEEASLVARHTEEETSPLSIVDDGAVNEDKLAVLVGRNYEELKRGVGIKNDFCIFFENENGDIVPIKQGVNGIGSPDIKVGGIKCGDNP